MPRRAFVVLAAALCGAAGCASSERAATRAVAGGGSYARRVQAVRPLVVQAARRHQVPAELVLAVIHVESSFRPDARSRAGARGLMQLMPRTAASLARRLQWDDPELDDPRFNIEAGTYYLAYLSRRFGGDLRLALAGYNAGPARVRRWQRRGRGLPGQVARYVKTVMRLRARFTADGPALQPPPEEGLDRGGLRALIRTREQLYGARPDEPLPDGGP